MNVDALCDSLLQTTTVEQRTALLTQADVLPECAERLMARAAQMLATSPTEALPLVALAAELALRRQDGRAAALAERTRAQALRMLGRHAEALTAFDAAMANALLAGDPKLAAQVQMGRIDSLGWLGRYQEAAAFGKRLIDTLRSENATGDAAKALVNLGNVHYRRDRFHEALDCYEQAAESMAQSGDAVSAARVTFNRANILSEHHRVEEAMRLFREVREVFAAQELTTEAAMTDFNIGVLHHRSGEYAAALTAQKRARRAFAESGQTLEAAKCDADMADVYRMLNLHTEALDGYAGAITVFETLPLDYERGRAELGRAAIYAAQGSLEEAGDALDRAESIFRQHRNVVQQAHVRLLRAYWRRARNEGAGAAEEAHAAARIFARHRLPARAAEARYVEAEIALREGQNATRTMAAVRGTARRYAQGWLECRAEQALGQYQARKGRTTRALRHLRASIEALESARTLVPGEDLHTAFIRDKLTVYEDLVALLLARGRPADLAEALEYVERSKSRLLLERVYAALAEPSESALPEAGTSEQRARLSTLRARLNLLYSQMQPPEGETSRLMTSPKVDAEALIEAETAYNTALHDMEQELSPGVFALAQGASTTNLQSWLDPAETLVEFYTAHGDICAFILTRESVMVQRKLATECEIAHLARRLRFHLQRAGSASEYADIHADQLRRAVQKPLASLYDLLLRPLEALLAEEKITLVPHGILHGLPFHAFFDGTSYALDRWEFTYAPSATLRYAPRRQWQTSESEKQKSSKTEGSGAQLSSHSIPPEAKADGACITPPPYERGDRGMVLSHSEGGSGGAVLPRNEGGDRGVVNSYSDALIMGVPDKRLTQIAVEVESISHMLPDARVFCGESATLSAFRDNAPHSRLIHLATHALFRDDNPLFSCLHFADGWLLARDVYGMRLRCDLVTLSACRTGQAGVESGDEMFGLLRGFLAAGAHTVAVSFWPAEDAATAALMTRFYTLLTQGQSRAASLRAAQMEVREKWRHPYHWAAFALFGER